YVQYGKWVGQFLQGNFGFSVRLNQSVASLIAERLPKTIILIALGLAVSLILGIPLGIYQAVKRYTVGDYVLTGISFLGYATPIFFFSILLIEWFAIAIPLFPPVGPPGDTAAQLRCPAQSRLLPVTAYAILRYA